MNRTDRLYAITEELRRVGPAGTTGARLARLLEVSERTIKRDISALQQAGVPVGAQAGPGGGYVIAGTATLPPINFTAGQAVAVAIALAALPAGTPFAADARAARGKVFDALGSGEQARARDLSDRVWIRSGGGADVRDGATPGSGTTPGSEPGPLTAPSGSSPSTTPTTDPAVVHAVEASMLERQALAITYRRADGTPSRRIVEPVMLAHTEGHWYLVAWCRERTAVRWFRMERIERADVTHDPYVPRDVADVGVPPDDAVSASTA